MKHEILKNCTNIDSQNTEKFLFLYKYLRWALYNISMLKVIDVIIWKERLCVWKMSSIWFRLVWCRRMPSYWAGWMGIHRITLVCMSRLWRWHTIWLNHHFPQHANPSAIDELSFSIFEVSLFMFCEYSLSIAFIFSISCFFIVSSSCAKFKNWDSPGSFLFSFSVLYPFSFASRRFLLSFVVWGWLVRSTDAESDEWSDVEMPLALLVSKS